MWVKFPKQIRTSIGLKSRWHRWTGVCDTDPCPTDTFWDIHTDIKEYVSFDVDEQNTLSPIHRIKDVG